MEPPCWHHYGKPSHSLIAVTLLKLLRMHYPSDPNTLAIQTQFFYGPSLLINPVTEENSDSVTFYVPSDVWYDFATQKRLPDTATGKDTIYADVPVTDIPILVRGGSILPLRVNSTMTTAALRKENFELLVAPGKDGSAQGTLYLDDGERLVQDGVSEIAFSWDGETLKVDGTFGYETNVRVKSITVLGDEAQKYDVDEGLGGSWEWRAAKASRL